MSGGGILPQRARSAQRELETEWRRWNPPAEDAEGAEKVEKRVGVESSRGAAEGAEKVGNRVEVGSSRRGRGGRRERERES